MLLAWGLAYGGVSVGLMTLMMKAAPRAVEIVAALYVGVFNVAIALGAWAGGQAVDGPGLSANLWLAAGCAAAALLLSLRIRFVEHAMKAAGKQLARQRSDAIQSLAACRRWQVTPQSGLCSRVLLLVKTTTKVTPENSTIVEIMI